MPRASSSKTRLGHEVHNSLLLVASVPAAASEERPKAAFPRVEIALHPRVPRCCRAADCEVPTDARYLTHEIACFSFVRRYAVRTQLRKVIALLRIGPSGIPNVVVEAFVWAFPWVCACNLSGKQ
jgi:hypothetical protein